MRFYFQNLEHPRKVAKRFHKMHSNTHWDGTKTYLADSQHIVATMYGYSDWRELVKVTKSAKYKPSRFDENIGEEEQRLRIDYQTSILRRYFALPSVSLRIKALSIRVTARSPRSEDLTECYIRENMVCFEDEYNEWRFIPSQRSLSRRDELYEALEVWDSQDINLGDYEAMLSEVSLQHPEDIVPYHYIISAAHEVNAWEYAECHFAKLENVIETSLPDTYPRKRKTFPFIWSGPNRDFLRAIFDLATGYYAVGEFKKAKKWFLFFSRCVDPRVKDSFETNVFLKDLRRKPPLGDVHL